MSVLPLSRYRVVDFGMAYAGGQPGQLLADMGAEVIKVESRRHLDGIRIGNPGKGISDPEERRPTFHCVARNKLDVTLDITQPEAQALVKRLVAQSDVVLENFSPGIMARNNIDYASLRQVNPQLVMVSLSAAGQNGPLRDIVVYAPAMAALSGLDSVVGYEGGDVTGLRTAYGDATGAIYGVIATLVGLYRRNRTGRGQYVDLSEWEATTTTMGEVLLEYVLTKRVPQPRSNYHPDMAPYGNYPCNGNDRWVAIAVKTEEEWAGLCRAMGNPTWCREARFADRFQRLRHIRELDPLVGRWTTQHTPEETTHVLQQEGVAAAPVLTYAEQYADPHFKARRTYEQVDHPRLPGEVIYGIPLKLSRTPGSIRRPAPLVGEHNAYVFRELLGLSDADVQRLAEAGVIH